MQIIYAGESFPTTVTSSLFLAGPSPRETEVKSWRKEALELLEKMNYQGHVFVPEGRDGKPRPDYDDNAQWEEDGLNRADCIVFWIERDMSPSSTGAPKLPGLTTNDEWGVWKNSGKVVLGLGNDVSVRYQKYYALKNKVSIFNSLQTTLVGALSLIKNGAQRVGGESEVPLLIWNTESFQNWYSGQKSAGNRLDGCRIEYSFRVGPTKNFVFLWIAHVNVYIVSENRNKTNELVIGRPDISTVLLWRKGKDLLDTDVVIVKEFRSPSRTSDGFIRELPGGSSKKNNDVRTIAAEEVHEEVGLVISPDRLIHVGTRQIGGTLSSFSGNCFSCELTDLEIEKIKYYMDSNAVFGIQSETERTYVQLFKLKDLIDKELTDWSTLGMIFTGLRSTIIKTSFAMNFIES